MDFILKPAREFRFILHSSSDKNLISEILNKNIGPGTCHLIQDKTYFTQMAENMLITNLCFKKA